MGGHSESSDFPRVDAQVLYLAVKFDFRQGVVDHAWPNTHHLPIDPKEAALSNVTPMALPV
ncbi:hypothetical protein D3C72_2436970 [compost metagenome]